MPNISIFYDKYVAFFMNVFGTSKKVPRRGEATRCPSRTACKVPGAFPLRLCVKAPQPLRQGSLFSLDCEAQILIRVGTHKMEEVREKSESIKGLIQHPLDSSGE